MLTDADVTDRELLEANECLLAAMFIMEMADCRPARYQAEDLIAAAHSYTQRAWILLRHNGLESSAPVSDWARGVFNDLKEFDPQQPAKGLQ